MRKREKLTPEERFALALALVKREQSLGDICLYYQVSHTTAYKLRNAFLDGARKALAAVGRSADGRDDDVRPTDGAADGRGEDAHPLDGAARRAPGRKQALAKQALA